MLQSIESVGAGLLALLGAAAIVAGLARWARAPATVGAAGGDETAIFLFEDGDLVDASPRAHGLLRERRAGSDLACLLALLSRRFGPDLGLRLASPTRRGRVLLPAPCGTSTLEAEEEGGRLRLTLRSGMSASAFLGRLSLESAQEELRTLRGLAEDSPHPIWIRDGTGALAWANRAYLELSDRMAPARSGADPAGGRDPPAPQVLWPTEPLFPLPAGLREAEAHRERLPLALPDRDEPAWYDVTSVRRGERSIHFAADATALVGAEAAKAHFVQALARTFAHLSTGLAIFDRGRRLVLFNPAFRDMTGLPVAFLSGRPLIRSVLDRLRDARIRPEPRDDASWREAVTAIEAAAAGGQYRGTWALPDGRTWRVTGRPHPDGGLAVLFEDITAEVGATRRLRSELDGYRAAIEALDDAVALFDSTGTLQAASAAYTALWGAPSPSGADLLGEVARWEAACEPAEVWAGLRNGGDPAPAVDRTLRRLDGLSLHLRRTPLPQGALLVAFRPETERPASRRAPRPAPAPLARPTAEGPTAAEAPRLAGASSRRIG